MVVKGLFTDMKMLNGKTTLLILREVWQDRKNLLREELEVNAKIDGEEKNILAPGLKIKSKKGILYTVVSVGNELTSLQAPEGPVVEIDNEQLEKDFELK